MKNTKIRTVLDQERQDKITQGEGKDYLDAITQPDEAKAADVIIATQKIAEAETKKDEETKKENLDASLKWTFKEYVFKLAQTMNELASKMDIPPGYYYRINWNDTKINLIVHHKSGKSFGRGIKPCGEVEYDFHAMGVLVTQCENTIDFLEERGQFRKDGLILPPTKRVLE